MVRRTQGTGEVFTREVVLPGGSGQEGGVCPPAFAAKCTWLCKALEKLQIGIPGNLTFLNITWGREGQGHEAVLKSPFVLANGNIKLRGS